MKSSEIHVIRSRRLNSAGLPVLEAKWKFALAALDAALESGLEGQSLEKLARRVEELEEHIAVSPAESRDDVAIKLRIILSYEEEEAERRHWYPILQSAPDDLEGKAALLS